MDSVPIIASGDFPPTGCCGGVVAAESIAELRLPREPLPPTWEVVNPDAAAGVAVGDCCCWFRAANAKSARRENGVWI